jgi:hypothetical protein
MSANGALDESMQKIVTAKLRGTSRNFRIFLVVILVILTVQGWFGDYVNIFVAPATGTTPPQFSLGGFFGAVQSLGFGLIWHTFEGIGLIALAAIAFALSFAWSRSRSVRIASGLGLLAIVSAAVGGFLFTMSGFSYGGGSAQMGGSFIGSYAMYFIALYYAK